MNEQKVHCRGIRFAFEVERVEQGHAFLYVLWNGQHVQPFGLLEDVYVEEAYREQGVAGQLVAAVVARARTERRYKLIATSRNDGTRDHVHDWYRRLGFADHGTEFRMSV